MSEFELGSILWDEWPHFRVPDWREFTVLPFFAVFPLISRRRFSQIEVLEGLNVLVCINGRKNKLRVYYLSWLRNKILKGDDVS